MLVLKGGREVARIERPVHHTAHGQLVKYKRRFWRLSGKTIDLANGSLDETVVHQPEPIRAEPPVVALPDDEMAGDGQEAVIHAPTDARLLVDAGPGTGKTHVACARVSALIRDGVSPTRIWIFSFTRTAVHELRNRLATVLDDPEDVASVRIATLDSYAWSLRSGFTKDAALSGSYDDNISKTLEQIKNDEDVKEYIQRLRHLIIDEAQDIVGQRADLILSIIDAVDDNCGVTVFADPAQAIYGFTEDEEVLLTSSRELMGELRIREFQEHALAKVHRTNSQGLLQIFTNVRQNVLDETMEASERGQMVRDAVHRFADKQIGSAKNLKLDALPEDALVLLRQRYDVLSMSSYNANVPHRLRMSGLPPCVHPWLAKLFWDFTERRLTRAEFEKRWADRSSSSQSAADVHAAWQLLYEAAGDTETVVDLHRLRTIIGRNNPPTVFCSPEFGESGPIVGTIHASKGREAGEVTLFLPPPQEADCDVQDEETRVLYVGATRARSKLAVGESSGARSRRTEGRIWRMLTGNRVQVEIGRMWDIDALGLVGLGSFASAGDARSAQEILEESPSLQNMVATGVPDLDWRHELQADGKRIGVLSERFKSDMKSIANLTSLWPPPNFFPYIRSMGVRTIALKPEDPALDKLHEPWRSSGFLLAPLLIGFAPSRMGKKK